jgi:hypothetical protein
MDETGDHDFEQNKQSSTKLNVAYFPSYVGSSSKMMMMMMMMIITIVHECKAETVGRWNKWDRKGE